MKRFYLFLCAAILSAGLFPSCSKETPNQFLYYVSTTGSVDYSRDAFLSGLGMPSAFRTYFDIVPDGNIRVESIHYMTDSPANGRTEVSGLISYPIDSRFKGVIISDHYTITDNASVPSVKMSMIDNVFSFFGYIVVIPDYLGFGASKNLPHPYLCRDEYATVSVDMLYAVREYLASQNITFTDDAYIIGYSEGGYAAVSTALYAFGKSDIDVIKVFAGGGPYDPMETYSTILKSNYVYFSPSIPLTFIGQDFGSSLHLDYANIFKGPLLANYDNWINSKNYDAEQITKFIGTTTVSDFIVEDAFTEATNKDFISMCNSLKFNSLINSSYSITAPIVLYHALNDNYVPFVNASNFYNYYHSRGDDVTLNALQGDHINGAISFYVNVALELGVK